MFLMSEIPQVGNFRRAAGLERALIGKPETQNLNSLFLVALHLPSYTRSDDDDDDDEITGR